jgi:ankyrin repeat protein
MLASHEGQAEMVKWLLEKGADANIKENTGKTALSMASSKGHEDVVKLLKEKKP